MPSASSRRSSWRRASADRNRSARPQGERPLRWRRRRPPRAPENDASCWSSIVASSSAACAASGLALSAARSRSRRPASSDRPGRSSARAWRSRTSPFSGLEGRCGFHRLEGLDGGARPAGGRLDRPDLQPGAVDPVRSAAAGQLSQHAQRPVGLVRRRKGSPQAVSGAIGEPAPGVVRQRPFVGRPRRREVVLGEADIAQVGPGRLQRRMIALRPRERLEGAACGGKVAGQVGEFAHAIPRGARTEIAGHRVEEIAEGPQGFGIAVLVEPRVAQAEEGVDPIGVRGPGRQEPLVFLGRQLELPLTQQAMRESQRVGDPTARRRPVRAFGPARRWPRRGGRLLPRSARRPPCPTGQDHRQTCERPPGIDVASSPTCRRSPIRTRMPADVPVHLDPQGWTAGADPTRKSPGEHGPVRGSPSLLYRYGRPLLKLGTADHPPRHELPSFSFARAPLHYRRTLALAGDYRLECPPMASRSQKNR